MGASRRYLYTLFQGQSVSIAGMLRTRRLEQASEMLRSGDPRSPLAHIAKQSGFMNAEALNRVFRARYGCLPSDYRSEHNARAATD